jgi:hypothetical protein
MKRFFLFIVIFAVILLAAFFVFALITRSDPAVEQGPTELALKGHIDNLSDQQTLSFLAEKGQKLNAILEPDPQGNIRINQIVSPSGESDGPFGQILEYDLNETGVWKLVIGGSLMQGDEYEGDFLVRIKLQ